MADLKRKRRRCRRDAQLEKHVRVRRIRTHRIRVLPVATLKIEHHMQILRRAAIRRCRAARAHVREETMLLHRRVKKVQRVISRHCRPAVPRVCRVAARLVHQVQRWVGLRAKKVATVTSGPCIRQQRVGRSRAVLERCSRQHELRQRQHVRCEELAVAVEVAPHLLAARRTSLQPTRCRRPHVQS